MLSVYILYTIRHTIIDFLLKLSPTFVAPDENGANCHLRTSMSFEEPRPRAYLAKFILSTVKNILLMANHKHSVLEMTRGKFPASSMCHLRHGREKF